MKQLFIITFFIIAFSIVFNSNVKAQLPFPLPSPNVGELVAGQHTPIIIEGEGTIFGSSGACTTNWVLISPTPFANATANRNISRFAPRYYVVQFQLDTYGAGSDADISTAHYEVSLDSTDTPVWNADSSNYFINNNAFAHPDYGIWKFNPIESTDIGYQLPLRIWYGGYFRMILNSVTDDTTLVRWRVICAH